MQKWRLIFADATNYGPPMNYRDSHIPNRFVAVREGVGDTGEQKERPLLLIDAKQSGTSRSHAL